MSDVVEKQPLTEDYLKKMDAYWRAANYLGAAQLYLLDNPLLREPLTRDQVKKKIVGHWGTVPGQNFVYVHLNRVIKKYDQDMILISGPGHGGNFFVANTYLEGTYSEVYPNIGEDMDGLKKLCKQFSFPGGISSHVAPETPDLRTYYTAMKLQEVRSRTHRLPRYRQQSDPGYQIPHQTNVPGNIPAHHLR